MRNICIVPGITAEGKICRIIWKNIQSSSIILERWREYFQKLMDEENLR